MHDFDLVVIGGGSTGLATAQAVARAGKKVALVDRGPVGGLCSLAGCNPKMVLVRATEVLQELRDADQHGIDCSGARIDWGRVWERKNRFTEPVPEQSEKSLAASGVELIRAEASFVSAEVLRAGSAELRAPAFVIATGSQPRRLTWPGVEHLRITDEVLELKEPPARMVIVGAGVVAFEFGHVFARLGTRVTIAMRTSRALANFDQDFLAPMIAYSEKLGIEFLTNTDVQKIERSGNSYRVHFTTGQRDADFILNAAGRLPAIEALNLAAANVEVGRKGVIVDDYLRSTSNRHVFAGGDARGRWQLSPVASYEGRVIARNILEGDVQRADYSAIPHAVFTVPPLAAVGSTEAELQAAGRQFIVKKNEMTGWKVFAIAGAQLAHAKVLLDPSTDRILGAQLLGEGSSETIHIFAMAIRAGLSAASLKDMVYAYPTFASATASLV